MNAEYLTLQKSVHFDRFALPRKALEVLHTYLKS